MTDIPRKDEVNELASPPQTAPVSSQKASRVIGQSTVTSIPKPPRFLLRNNIIAFLAGVTAASAFFVYKLNSDVKASSAALQHEIEDLKTNFAQVNGEIPRRLAQLERDFQAVKTQQKQSTEMTLKWKDRTAQIEQQLSELKIDVATLTNTERQKGLNKLKESS